MPNLSKSNGKIDICIKRELTKNIKDAAKEFAIVPW